MSFLPPILQVGLAVLAPLLPPSFASASFLPQALESQPWARRAALESAVALLAGLSPEAGLGTECRSIGRPPVPMNAECSRGGHAAW